MENITSDTPPRPFGYWLTAVDRLMAAEFARVFDSEGLTRRDWRLLNVIDGTTAARRPLTEHKLHLLIERGWVTEADNGWTLTDDGLAAKKRLGALVDGIRSQISDAVSPDEFTTTLAALEKIARSLGWDETTPLPRGRGRHGQRGFGRRGHGFPDRHFDHRPHSTDGCRHPEFAADGFAAHDGHAHAHDHGHAHAHGGDAHGGHAHGAPSDCGHHERHGRAHGGDGHSRGRDHNHSHRTARLAQGAYERGFDAGFQRGRDA